MGAIERIPELRVLGSAIDAEDELLALAWYEPFAHLIAAWVERRFDIGCLILS